jgi:hypothetical protein
MAKLHYNGPSFKIIIKYGCERELIYHDKGRIIIRRSKGTPNVPMGHSTSKYWPLPVHFISIGRFISIGHCLFVLFAIGLSMLLSSTVPRQLSIKCLAGIRGPIAQQDKLVQALKSPQLEQLGSGGLTAKQAGSCNEEACRQPCECWIDMSWF